MRTRSLKTIFTYGLLAACLGASLTGCGAASAERTPNRDDYEAIRKLVEAGAAASGGDTGAALPDPTGWATITGTFRVAGNVSPPSPLSIQSNVPVCISAPIYDESLVVDSATGGVKDVLIWLDMTIPDDSDQGENAKWVNPQAVADNAPKVFDQKECVFLSHVFYIRTAQTLRIANSDPIGHNTNIQFGRNTAFNQSVGASGYVDLKLRKQERSPVKVSCNVHGWMQAYMIVRDSPYMATTDQKGAFTIANVPAGVELKFKAWQERAGFLRNVEAGVDGASPAPTTWRNGKFTIPKLQDGQTYKLDVVIRLPS